MYFQRVEVRALSITLDYLPRRLDLAALRAGSTAEVLPCSPLITNMQRTQLVRLAASIPAREVEPVSSCQNFKRLPPPPGPCSPASWQHR